MKKVHYAWVICGVTCLIYICTIGMLSNSSFGPYILSDGGLSKTQYSMIVSVRSIFSMIFTALCGLFYTKVPLRFGLSTGLFVGALSFVLWGVAPSYTVYLIGAALAGVVHGLAANVATAMVINNWFTTRRNLAFGITTASSGLTAVILPPVVRGLVETYSLKVCFFTVAAFFALIGLLSFVLIRDKPEQKNLQSYGFGLEDIVRDGKKKKVSSGAPAGTYAPSKLHFWLLMIVYFFIGGQLYATWSHVSVLFSNAGFNSASFSTLLSITGIALMCGKILYGYVTDKTNAEISFYIFCPLQAIGLLINAYAASNMNFTLAIVGCLLEGGAGVISTVGLSSMASELYRDNAGFNKAVVWFTTFYNIGHTVFSPMFGIIADTFGSYSPAYYGASVLGFANVVIVAYVFRGANKRAKALKLIKTEEAPGAV